jgi:hypothetical protein
METIYWLCVVAFVGVICYNQGKERGLRAAWDILIEKDDLIKAADDYDL